MKYLMDLLDLLCCCFKQTTDSPQSISVSYANQNHPQPVQEINDSIPLLSLNFEPITYRNTKSISKKKPSLSLFKPAYHSSKVNIQKIPTHDLSIYGTLLLMNNTSRYKKRSSVIASASEVIQYR